MHNSNPIPRRIKQAVIPVVAGLMAAVGIGLSSAIAQARPNGTWLSKPQIWFHTSNNTLDQVIQRIQSQQYRYVFLDVRNVSDADQRNVTQKIRDHNLIPIVWVQSPQLRSMSVQDLIYEARHADGIQVDDHYFSHYSQADFYQLRRNYTKPIFCSIQPFQAKQLPTQGCNQVDVQCYTPQSFKVCMGLADRLKAVTSLSATNTLQYQNALQGRVYNVFLWPHSNDFLVKTSQANW